MTESELDSENVISVRKRDHCNLFNVITKKKKKKKKPCSFQHQLQHYCNYSQQPSLQLVTIGATSNAPAFKAQHLSSLLKFSLLLPWIQITNKHTLNGIAAM